MKRFLTVVLAALLAAGAACGASKGPLRPVTPAHPRLFLTDEGMAAMKAKVAAGEEAAVLMHAAAMKLADDALASSRDLKYELDASGRRILHWSRMAIERITSCAYAFRYTGDRRYLEHALKDIRTVCAFPDWNSRRHFLDVAEMAYAVGVGYDWLYDEIPGDLKAVMEKAVHDYAFVPARGPEGFYWRTNNWNEVCNAGMVVAALGIYDVDDPEVLNAVSMAVQSNPASLRILYAPDGNYAEGPAYWNYGTSFEVLMLTAIEDILGTDYGLSRVEGFSNTAGYVNFSHGATRQFFNYADNGSGDSASAGMWYFAWKQNDPSLLYYEMKTLRDGLYTCSGEAKRLTPCLTGYVARMETGAMKAPSDKFYYGRGVTPVVMVHTDWTYSDTDKYLGIKGGAAVSPHGHMDAGSFVYDAYGCRWAMDYDRPEYAVTESRMKEIGGNLWSSSPDSYRWKVFRYNNRQHNTLTINDRDHSVKGNAAFTGFFKEGKYLGATVDMTGVFEEEAASVTRTVRLVDEKYLEVTDVVTALPDKDADVRWTMVTPAKAAVGKSSIRLTQGGRTLKLTTRSDGAKASYTSWSSDPADYDYEFSQTDKAQPGVSHVGFTARVPAGRTATFITTLK